MGQEQNDIIPAASSFRMVTLGLVLVLPSFLYGLNLAYPTIALPQMGLDVDGASWFGSVAIYVTPLSSLLVGVIIDTLGRRAALLYSIIPSIAGWSLLYWGNSTTLKLTGQILNGLTVGAVFYPAQVYAGECIMMDSIRYRNSFLTWIGFSSALGTTLMLSLANVFDYRQICVICLALCICLLFVFFIVIPESPSWLYCRGRISEAKRAEKKLGIRQPILYQPSPSNDSQPFSGTKSDLSWLNFKTTLQKIKRRDVYKPVLILSGSGLLLPFSGIFTCNTYMIDILAGHIPGTNESAPQLAPIPPTELEVNSVPTIPLNATSDTFDAAAAATAAAFQVNKYSILCGLCMCAGCLLSSAMFPYLGVKKLIIASNTCSIVGLMVLMSVYDAQPCPRVVWMRLGAIIWLAFLFGFILGPISACSGDIYPADAKGFASLSDICANLAAASANKAYPYLCLMLGGYAYCVFATLGILGAIYVHFLAPEVVGLSLDEISSKFLEKPAKK